MTMPWVQPQPKRSVMVGRREDHSLTRPAHPCLIVTSRCGHKWVTSGPVGIDLCVSIERLLNHHESLCSPGLTHRLGW